MSEITIRLHIKSLDEGGYVARSPDVPGLVAEGRTIYKCAELAAKIARTIAESCIDHGDPLPPIFSQVIATPTDLKVAVQVG